LKEAMGTPLYYSPQKTALNFNGEEADYWALACTLYMLFFNSFPPWFEKLQEAFQDKDPLERSRELTKLVKSLFSEPKNPASIKHLIWRMLCPDVRARPTLDSVIERLKIVKKPRPQIVNPPEEGVKKPPEEQSCILL